MEAFFPTPHWPCTNGSFKLSLTPSPIRHGRMPDYFLMALKAPSVPLSGNSRFSPPFKAPVLLCSGFNIPPANMGKKTPLLKGGVSPNTY